MPDNPKKTLHELEIEMQMDAMRNNAKALVEYQFHVAPLVHSYYKALISAGFDEKQALQLVMAHGVVPPISQSEPQ